MALKPTDYARKTRKAAAKKARREADKAATKES